MKRLQLFVISATLVLGSALPARGNPGGKTGTRSQVYQTTAETGQPSKGRTSRAIPAINRNPKAAISSWRQSIPAVATPRKAGVPAMAADSQYPQILGNVNYRLGWIDNAYGIYDIATDGTSPTMKYSVGGQYGGVLIDGVYYVCYQDYMQYPAPCVVEGYDIDTGEKVADYSYFLPEGYDPTGVQPMPVALTHDYTDGCQYGLFRSNDYTSFVLARTDFANGLYQPEEIGRFAAIDGNIELQWMNIAASPDGQLYAIAAQKEMSGHTSQTTNSNLYRISKADASRELVGAIGLKPQNVSGLVFDPNTGRLFWTYAPTYDSSFLYELDPATAIPSLICQFPEADWITGLVIRKETDPATPQAPADVTAAFNAGQLSGKVSFNAPSQNIDGTTGTSLTYKIKANGQEVASGTCAYGAHVTADVTVAAAGNYSFAVTVAAGNLVSKSVSARAFVGHGCPAAPEVSASWSAGRMTVTWTAVTTSADGGYLDPANVTYTVTDSNTAAVIADNLTGTSHSFAVAEPEALTVYRYDVTASYEGKTATATSQPVALGALTLPYSNALAWNDNCLLGFTIIDANGDGNTWEYEYGTVKNKWSSAGQADDWLITPPMNLEQGKLYPFSIKLFGGGNPERFEIKTGTAPTAEAMTVTLIEPTEIVSTEPVKYTAYLAPATTGRYYIGVHGISDEDQLTLTVKDLAIGTATATTAPGAVTALKATPDPTGAYNATISFNAPAIDLAGNTLTAITRIDVCRDGMVVKSFADNCVAGEAYSCTDAVGYPTTATYTVTAYNDDGAGKESAVTLYVGTDIPAMPSGITIEETANPGEVTVGWAPVTQDHNGNAISPDKVTYGVYQLNQWGYPMPLVTGLTGTSHTFAALDDPSRMAFVQYYVGATSEAGTSESAATDMICVGNPATDYRESFEKAELTYPMGTRVFNGEVMWTIATDMSLAGVTSQDDDNGFLYMQSNPETADGQPAETALLSCKVDLAGIDNPALDFYTFNIFTKQGAQKIYDFNLITVEARVAGNGEWRQLLSKAVKDFAANPETQGWCRVNVPLTGFEGQVIEYRVTTRVLTFTAAMFDNFRVAPKVDDNMVVRRVDHPTSVKPGQEYTVNVTVSNEGFNPADAYTVELFADGEAVASAQGTALDPEKHAVHVFRTTMHPLADEPVELYARLTYAADQNQADNTSATTAVNPIVSTLPRVEDLAGELAEGAAHLRWSQPAGDTAPAQHVSDSFEDAEAWSHNYGDWTFIDADGEAVTGFENVTGIGTLNVPGITPGDTRSSFFVWNREVGSDDFMAHSGMQYLASIGRYDEGQVDDWAISPALSGEAQTVSFFAKSCNGLWPETISVYYSTTGREPADFIAVEGMTHMRVPRDWTFYSADLPAGARFFAIRNHGTNTYMLMVDDVDFTAGSLNSYLEVKGYDIYRNGTRINDAPVAATTFDDPDTRHGDNIYRVTTVYNLGVSAGSNAIKIYDAGINETGSQITVSALPGAIMVKGAQGLEVTVTDVAGRIAHSATAGATERIPVAPGIYLTRVNGHTVKLMVD